MSPGTSVIEGICLSPFHPHRLFSGMLLLVFPILQGRTCYRVYRKSDAQSSSSPQVKEMTRESSVGLLQLILFCYFICSPSAKRTQGKELDPYTCSVFGHMYLPYPTTVTSSLSFPLCVCVTTLRNVPPHPPKKTCSPIPLPPTHGTLCTNSQIFSCWQSATCKAHPQRSRDQGCPVLTFCSNPNR